MNKFIFLFLAMLSIKNSHGQTNYINVCDDCMHNKFFDFNSTADSTFYYFSIDTSQPGNLWQQGIPDKALFKTGYMGPKAFITDTANPYPVNNVSSFVLLILNCYGTYSQECGGYMGMSMTIVSKIESDESKDGGTVEVSHNGSSFVNLIEDPLFDIHNSSDIYSQNDTVESLGKPGYSGISDDWNVIDLSLRMSLIEPYDTIILKFTFSSDSIDTGKDGWMIGLIDMDGMFEGIQEIQNDNLITIYPNPTSGDLRIKRINSSSIQRVQISNFSGQLLYDNQDFNGETIHTQQLPNGVYLLKYSDSDYFAVKKLIVQH